MGTFKLFFHKKKRKNENMFSSLACRIGGRSLGSTRSCALKSTNALRLINTSSARLFSVRSTLRSPTHIATSRRQPTTLVRSPQTLHKRNYAAVVVNVPSMGDSITSGEVSWVVEVGDEVEADDTVCEIETDKIGLEVRAPQSGKIVERLFEDGDTVEVGAELFKLEPGEVTSKASSEPTKEEAPAASSSSSDKGNSQESTPAAEQKSSSSSSSSSPKGNAPSSDVSKGSRTERRVKMKKIRTRIAERLKDSQNTYAMLTTFNEIDMGALIEMRTEYKEAFEKQHGVKLGFMSAFAKAASDALRAQPTVNAVIDGNETVFRDHVDISVAVSSPNGLVVPVLRNVEDMSLADIERNIGELAGKARNNSLSMEDMTGGTFTISNGGVFGSLMGTPIINPPQSAILGMHATQPRPVARDGKVEIRPMMYVALTYDHRLIDGREAVTFLVHIKKAIEDPRRMLLGL